MRDVDAIAKWVRAAVPDVRVAPIATTHPADREDLWYFDLPGFAAHVQIESASGTCPFVVESTIDDSRVVVGSVEEAVAVVVARLRIVSESACRSPSTEVTSNVLHYLTVGFFDETAIARQEIRAVSPVSAALRALLVQSLDGGDISNPMMEGQSVIITEEYIRCPWYALRANRTAAAFALRARRELGCTIADLTRSIIVTSKELEATGRRRIDQTS